MNLFTNNEWKEASGKLDIQRKRLFLNLAMAVVRDVNNQQDETYEGKATTRTGTALNVNVQ